MPDPIADLAGIVRGLAADVGKLADVLASVSTSLTENECRTLELAENVAGLYVTLELARATSSEAERIIAAEVDALSARVDTVHKEALKAVTHYVGKRTDDDSTARN